MINDVEIFANFMFFLAKIDLDNNIVNHIHDEDGPYFALTKAETYIVKFKRGLYK
jgi:hypothetical protein